MSVFNCRRKIDKEDELQESPILDLLGQAIKGIEGELGLGK
jgi:hypothetical protein